MSVLERRRLGRIGYEASIVTLGGCGVGRLDQREADRAVELALSYGINIVDVAPSYGEAESRLAGWIQRYRDKLFLAEKTLKRTRDGVLEELHIPDARPRGTCGYRESFQPWRSLRSFRRG